MPIDLSPLKDPKAVRVAVAKATSWKSALKMFGLSHTSYRADLLRRTAKEHSIDISHLTRRRHTDDDLRKAIQGSRTWVEAMHKLGIKHSGGFHTHLRKRAKRLGLDTSHFVGSGWARGQPSKKKRDPSSILVVQKRGHQKTRTVLLRRALLEIGVEEVCVACGQRGIWNGKPLTLQIDHINGDPFDHRAENLRFLCPNCHTQTPTYGNKK